MRLNHNQRDENPKKISMRPNGRRRVQTIIETPTLTQQQFAEQCNVNNIIAKYRKTGSLTHVRNVQEGVYADLTQLPSLQDAYMTVQAAESAFAEIPSEIRQRFGHDPRAMIKFLENPNNKEEAIKLGLVKKPKVEIPDPVVEQLKEVNKNLKKTKTTSNI